MYNDMAIFLEIVDANSLIRAAKNLKISQATVSRRLKALEQELEVPLIIRNTRGLEVTTEGMMLYHELKKQQVSLMRTVDELRQVQSSAVGRIRVALPVVLSYDIITPYLAEFVQNHPEIELEICYHNREIDILREHFDIAIVNYVPRQQTVKMRRLYSIDTALYCSPKYIERYGEPKNIESLNIDHLCVGHINFDMTTNRMVYVKHDIDGDSVHRNRGRFFTNNALHNKQIALSGHAIAGGWDELFMEELQSGELIRLFPEYTFGTISFYLLKLTEYDNVAVKAFLEFLESCFARVNKQKPTL
ncbi:MAG: LysR family transcriptional regulator [Proteobacteria bacterium]|nr:MAG: LysR family transcriptional regulator [Pseudomonadota bacterium]